MNLTPQEGARALMVIDMFTVYTPQNAICYIDAAFRWAHTGEVDQTLPDEIKNRLPDRKLENEKKPGHPPHP